MTDIAQVKVSEQKPSCRSCSAAVENGRFGERCRNGFVQGPYSDGSPLCLRDDVPRAWWLFPPDQWDELREPATFGATVPAQEES